MRFHFAPLALALPVLFLGGSLPAQDKEEPKRVEPTNLTKVNTKADEADPFPGPEGTALYYASNAGGSLDLMIARRANVGATWQAGAPLKDLNTAKYDERSPRQFGPRFYFATDAPPSPEFEKLKNLDILERSGSLAPLRSNLLSTRDDEAWPWVASGGKDMYFCRKTKDGWRVFLTSGPAKGAPEKGKMLDFLAPGFQHPTIAPNGLTMYLQGPLDKGRWGIFRSTRKTASAAWGEPEPLEMLNHPEGEKGDMCPSLNAAGTFLYSASDRPGGQGGLDIWVIATAKLPEKK